MIFLICIVGIVLGFWAGLWRHDIRDCFIRREEKRDLEAAWRFSGNDPDAWLGERDEDSVEGNQ